MNSKTLLIIKLALLQLIFSFGTNQSFADGNGDLERRTSIVDAVQQCQPSVVNIRGRKTVKADSSNSQAKKQVNGMGTGIVIDSRGYLLTNYHVVQGVRTIEVTTSDRQKTTAKLLAHDPETDLAILKINTREPLPPIKIGTSSDLLLAEQVIAIGNAYGYEHTVTTGIVSSLSRTVQVNDEQIYRNLIQTDAAINPGNSGGPLLNIYGELIGINVAVRIGAQGIAFAIPANDAIDVAADLMSEILPAENFHGLTLETEYVDHNPRLKVISVAAASPAANEGIKPGSYVSKINGRSVNTRLDFQTSMLNSSSKREFKVELDDDTVVDLVFTKASHPVRDTSVKMAMGDSMLPKKRNSAAMLAWNPLGMKLTPASEAELQDRHPKYKRGLRVVGVRPRSPAEAEGIMPGDVLVAMHGWKTESIENLAYILQRPDVVKRQKFLFYILRDKEPFWGQMRVASLPR
ncbi:trypsin-like peptidase domain-containing protein [Mariniblastus sp.]|nr:trypsin-like peptidase domain-containing protein [Mariniblastus sp.]